MMLKEKLWRRKIPQNNPVQYANYDYFYQNKQHRVHYIHGGIRSTCLSKYPKINYKTKKLVIYEIITYL